MGMSSSFIEKMPFHVNRLGAVSYTHLRAHET